MSERKRCGRIAEIRADLENSEGFRRERCKKCRSSWRPIPPSESIKGGFCGRRSLTL